MIIAPAIPVIVAIAVFTSFFLGYITTNGVLIVEASTTNAPSAMPIKAFDWVDTSSPRATFRSFLIGTHFS